MDIVQHSVGIDFIKADIRNQMVKVSETDRSSLSYENSFGKGIKFLIQHADTPGDIEGFKNNALFCSRVIMLSMYFISRYFNWMNTFIVICC